MLKNGKKIKYNVKNEEKLRRCYGSDAS